MSFFLFLVWAGGATMDYPRKIGFWKRASWPVFLGEAVFRWAIQHIEAQQ